MITFPHCTNSAVRDLCFVAAWIEYVNETFPGRDWRTFAMPRLNVTEVFDNVQPGLDQLCRRLVRPGCRSVMQATNPFMNANQSILKSAQAVNPQTGRQVNGAQLTDAALRDWDRLSDGDSAKLRFAFQAVLESDPELDDTDASTPESGAIAIPSPLQANAVNLLKMVVGAIHADEVSHLKWRRRAIPNSGPIRGWSERLNSYFWPSPEVGRRRTEDGLAPMRTVLADAARALAQRLAANGVLADFTSVWSAADQQAISNVVMQMFQWGGTPQGVFDIDTIGRVLARAITEDSRIGAPMTSGWTKVAALATDGLSFRGQDVSQAIWDSRVAVSLIGRLQVAGQHAGTAASALFPDLVLVPARAEDRKARIAALSRHGWSIRSSGT